MATDGRDTTAATFADLIMLLAEEIARRIEDRDEAYEAVVLILDDLLSEEPLSKSWH